MKIARTTALGVTAVTASLLAVAGALPANADYAPSSHDIVGVGGDTPQFDLAFGADGDTLGDPGFNAANNVNRLVTFNAVADGNGRAAYGQGSSEATPVPLNPTVVLRAGTSPVQRVQSSGAAITALLADTAKQPVINFIFSASKPTAAQQAQAGTNGWGYLHVVQIAKDAVVVAAAKTTNAPKGLSIKELLSIYTGQVTKWNQLAGNTAGSSDTIVPLIPPSSSSITKTFLADLKSANGGTAPTLSASVKTVEQNDPTAITGSSSPADAIAPFSSARLALFTSGYFHTPTATFPGGAAIDPGVAVLNGVTPDAATAYSSEVDHFVIFRQSDSTSKTAFEPGSALNWVQALFSNPSSPASPFFAKATGQALIAAAGATPTYVDLGNVSSG